MSAVTLSPPPIFTDYRGVQSYLFQMSEQLNIKLSGITTQKFWEESSRAVTASGGGLEDKALLDSYNSIKSLIIKTTGDVIVNSEEFKLRLGGEYLAKSQFGQYFETATVDINGNAYGITQLYNYTATVDSAFANYRVESENYITHGLLYYDGATPVYGVGVGVLGERVTVNDKQVLNKNNLFAAYTADEIAFWGNDTKLAYITPTSVYFPSAVITGGSININDKFGVTNAGAMTATEGTIGGWEITSNHLKSQVADTTKMFYIASASSPNANWIGAYDANGYEIFYLTKDGLLSAENVHVKGEIYADSLTLGNGVTIPYSKLSSTPDLTVYVAKDGVIGATPADGVTGFKLSREGLLTCSNAVIYGTCYASAGKIGGWNITTSYIDTTVPGTTKRLFLASASDSSSYWMGAVNSSGTATYYVTKEGKLYASGADIAGKLTSVEGSIGGWTIDGNGLDGSSGAYRALIKKTNIGISGNVVFGAFDGSSWCFYVDGVGKLFASNAEISGKITATSGSIGGCAITGGVLKVASANITSVNASNITSGTLSTARLSSSVITTDNFATKTLSTNNMVVGEGCRLGVASNNNVLLYASTNYTMVRAFGSPNYEVSFWTIAKNAVQSSSSSAVKTDIADLDDRYDAFFDRLAPKKFKYTFEPDEGCSMGFIWETTQQALLDSNLTMDDCGALYENASIQGGKGLRKADFVALNTWQIQKLKTRIAALEASIGGNTNG